MEVQKRNKMWSTLKHLAITHRNKLSQQKFKQYTKQPNSMYVPIESFLAPSLDLNAEIINTGVTNGQALELLIQNCHEFVDWLGNDKIKEIIYSNCGKGNGYLSLVIKIYIKKTMSNTDDKTIKPKSEQSNDVENLDQSLFSVVLKVPMPSAIKNMMESDNKTEKTDMDELDENTTTIIEGHNRECEFYERFGSILHDYPIPKVYFTQQFISGSDQIGLIIMENLENKCEILGIDRSATEAQIYGMARLLAQLQFRIHQIEKHRDWWMSLENNLHLDAFYNSWMPIGLPAANSFDGLASLMPKLKTICNSAFGRFALRQRPTEYDAISFCHGDIQMYNIFYKKGLDDQLTDDLMAMIDFQIVMYGNPCFDLARYLVFCANSTEHLNLDNLAYSAYYVELTRLCSLVDKSVPFTFEQGFELFELAFCHQTTYLTTFLYFFGKMAKQSETVARNLVKMGERARFCVTKTNQLIDKHNLQRFADA